MIGNLLVVASLLSPLAFWLAAPRRVPAPLARRCRCKNKSFLRSLRFRRDGVFTLSDFLKLRGSASFVVSPRLHCNFIRLD